MKRIKNADLMTKLNIRSYRKLHMLSWMAGKVKDDIELTDKDIGDKLKSNGYKASVTDYVYAYQAMQILKLTMEIEEFGGDSSEHLEITGNV